MLSKERDCVVLRLLIVLSLDSAHCKYLLDEVFCFVIIRILDLVTDRWIGVAGTNKTVS